jgi:hypothetical protein
MRRPSIGRLAAAAALFGAAGGACASQFYLFPIEHVEGLSRDMNPQARPMIEPAMRDLLTRDDRVRAELHGLVQTNLLQQLQQAYPGSVVNPAQISTTRGGGSPAYLPEVSCGQGFRAPLRQSYAVVVGLSRASMYTVPRNDGRVEVLVPITLNLLLLKPDAGKLVNSLSETRYSSFFFSSDEWGTPAARQLILDRLRQSLPEQLASLVEALKGAFQPREIVARVLGEDQKSFVLDKGYESGLREGEQIEVALKGGGREILVAVLSTDAGYSVVRPIGDVLRRGDELVLSTGAAADDSRKPRVLPVISQREGRQWTASVAEIFSKQIGFDAPFQILPADPYFGETLTLVDASLRCLDERAKKAMKKTAGERTEEPNFFLRFEHARSPTFSKSGRTGVEVMDRFITTVTAQLVDGQGDVVFSAIGSNSYKQTKVDGQGLKSEEAAEVSLKNATQVLARKVAERARLDPAEFKVERADGGRLWVKGLVVPEGESLEFQVLRPLSVDVGPSKARRRLAVAAGDVPPAAEASVAALSWVSTQGAQPDDQPRAGDLLRVMNLSASARVRYSECRGAKTAGSNSMAAEHLLPALHHAAYGSQRFQVNVATPEWVADANALLKANNFGSVLRASTPTEVCVRAAYVVRPEPPKCASPDECSTQIRVTSAVVLDKAGNREAAFAQSHNLTIDGFPEAETPALAGFKAHEHVLKTLPELTTILNESKK